MTKGPIGLTVSLACVATLVLAPLAVPAERFHGGPVDSRSSVIRPVAPHPIGPLPFVSHPFFHRRFFHRVTPFGVIAWPIVVYAPPTVYGPLVYADSPSGYGPPASPGSPAGYDPPLASLVSITPPPAPMPTVIEYPTGRYELRGDGMTTPYRWVWIPNPPSPPPQEIQASAPVSPVRPVSGNPSSVRHSQLYHWTDEQGVEHWTDRGEVVPEQHRGSAATPPRPS